MNEFIQNFHFIRPLWLLALIPMSFLLLLNWKTKLLSRSWKVVCDQRLLPYILVDSKGSASRFPLILTACIGFITVVALAGPTWKELPQPLYRTQSSLVIVLDLSASMDANDIQPSRIERAKLKIQDILERRSEGQTALVVYSQEAFVVSPLTDDTKTISSLVTSLDTQIMPTQGSQPLVAIQKSTDLLQQAGSRNGYILLISDGVGDSDVGSIVETVKSKGHTLSVLAIGTEDGAPIARGGSFLKDASGDIVVARLEEAPLRQLAGESGGRYSRFVTGDSDIEYLLSPLELAQRQSIQQKDQKRKQLTADRWKETGPWLLLFILPFVALVFRRGWVAVVVLLILPLPDNSHALELSDIWVNKNQKGLEYFEQDKYKAAAKEFDKKEWRAASYYKSQDYETALQLYQGINTAEGYYNKGNTLAKLGRIEEAIQAYDQTLELEPEHDDARFNKEVLKKYLQSDPDKQNDKQQQSQQQQQDSKQPNSQDKQQNDQNSQQDRKPQDDQQGQQGEKGDQGQEQQQADSQQQKQQSGDKRDDNSDENGDDEQMIKQQAENDARKEAEQQAAQSDGQNKSEQENKEALAKQQQQHEDKSSSEKSRATVSKQMSEADQANQQWLRRIPDDPGGLLRRKFLYQSQRNRSQGNGAKPW